jgi:uncharacterized membrane protein
MYVVPIRLLDLASLTIGVAIVAWLVYNIFVGRQAQFTGVRSDFQLAVPILLIIFGWRWLKRRSRPIGGTKPPNHRLQLTGGFAPRSALNGGPLACRGT